MNLYAPVQFRTADIKESNLSFSFTFPEGIKINGSFGDFEAVMVYAENDVCRTVLKIVLYADSVKAETEMITQKILESSCLNIHQYRVVSFESTDWVKVTDNEYLLYGNLFMCGHSKLIVFEIKDRSINSTKENNKLRKLEFDGIIHPSDFKIKLTTDTEDEIALKGSLVFKNEVTSYLHEVKNKSIL